MERRRFLTATTTALLGFTGSVAHAGTIAAESPTSPPVTTGHRPGPTQGHTNCEISPQISIVDSLTRQHSKIEATAEEAVLTGELHGNFSSTAGKIVVNVPGADVLVTDVLSNGTFALDVPRGEPLDLAYLQRSDSNSLIALNDNPDIYYIDRLKPLENDRDIGTVEIPEGNLLNVQFVDGSGTPLEGITASVRSIDTASNRWWEIVQSTDSDGFYRSADSPTGIEMTGEVEIAVLPDPDDSRVPDAVSSKKQLTITGSQTETITIDPITVTGKVTRSDTVSARGDKLIVPTNSGAFASQRIDSAGRFELQLPPCDEATTGAYEIQYYRQGVLDPDEALSTGRSAHVYAGPQIEGTTDEDVGLIEVPQGNPVELRTLAESEAINQVMIACYQHRNQTAGSTAGVSTYQENINTTSFSTQSKLTLPEDVEISITPSETDEAIDIGASRTVTVDDPTTVDLLIRRETNDEPSVLFTTMSPAPVATGGTRVVTATVTDSAGAGIAGVRVAIPELGAIATTDNQGNATLSVTAREAKDYEVSIRADGFPDATTVLTATDDTVEDSKERVLRITGKRDSTELDQDDVTAVITQFERGESVNGVRVNQSDVTSIITLFQRNS